MFVIVAALLGVAAPGACVAWRDPDSGKVMNARELRDREDAMRRRMLNLDASDRSVIDTARRAPVCIQRADEAGAARP